MKDHTGQFKVSIKLEPRPDGGLRVSSPDVPGLVLSGKDPKQVLGDVLPAVQTILADRMGCAVKANWLLPISAVIKDTAAPAGAKAEPTLTPTSVFTRMPSFNPATASQRARHLELAAFCA